MYITYQHHQATLFVTRVTHLKIHKLHVRAYDWLFSLQLNYISGCTFFGVCSLKEVRCASSASPFGDSM